MNWVIPAKLDEICMCADVKGKKMKVRMWFCQAVSAFQRVPRCVATNLIYVTYTSTLIRGRIRFSSGQLFGEEIQIIWNISFFKTKIQFMNLQTT